MKLRPCPCGGNFVIMGGFALGNDLFVSITAVCYKCDTILRHFNQNRFRSEKDAEKAISEFRRREILFRDFGYIETRSNQGMEHKGGQRWATTLMMQRRVSEEA